MDLRQLQTFVAIYESGGISRAAERERSAPSVLTHHLANLQGQFPKPLFIRNQRGMLATKHGKRLYAHAVHILRARSAEPTSDLQSLIRIYNAYLCFNNNIYNIHIHTTCTKHHYMNT